MIGFGGNLGDRRGNIDRMLALAQRTAGVGIRQCSSLYETAPVGGPEQGAYLNGVFLADCELGPEVLLVELQEIENALGRVRTVRWGPRTMDLDILVYGDCTIDTPHLTVPHPRMAERAFVLIPAAEIAPDLVHPVQGCTIRELRDRLVARLGRQAVESDVRLWAPPPL